MDQARYFDLVDTPEVNKFGYTREALQKAFDLLNERNEPLFSKLSTKEGIVDGSVQPVRRFQQSAAAKAFFGVMTSSSLSSQRRQPR